MKSLTKNLTFKLHEIKDVLVSENPIRGDSLFSGKTGELLFLFNYFNLTNDKKVLDYSYDLLESIFENLATEYFSFSSGYAGIGWFLEHCSKQGWLEIDVNTILEEVDSLVYSKSLSELKKGNYDFLHGALGGGLYFLDRTESLIGKDFLDKLILGIDAISEQDANHAKLPFYNFSKNQKEENTYNLGLSHGIPSIMSFLTLAEIKGIKPKICRNLNKKILGFILHNQMDFRSSNCCFPSSVMNSNPNRSRLAWCYGDLGIACSLWTVKKSQNVDKKLIHEKLIEVMNNNTTRKNLIENKVYDAGLCHGTAGIAHVFNVMHRRTGESIYRKSAEYWFDQTLLFSCFDCGLAGFKTYDVLNDLNYNNRGFLEGISGIGLALTSFLNPNESHWDRALLIN